MIIEHICMKHGNTIAIRLADGSTACVKCLEYPFTLRWCSAHGASTAFIDENTGYARCVECHREELISVPVEMRRRDLVATVRRVEVLRRDVLFYRTFAVFFTMAAVLAAVGIAFLSIPR